jgi:HK97 family phage major capsid protein
MGFPVIENPDVAATGLGAKSVLFGWFGSYHVRSVGGIEIARSDDAYFESDEIGFRVTLRLWGDLGQADAVKHFIGNAA